LKSLFVFYFCALISFGAYADEDVLPEEVFKHLLVHGQDFITAHKNDEPVTAAELILPLIGFYPLQKSAILALGVEGPEDNTIIQFRPSETPGNPRTFLVLGGKFSEEYYRRPDAITGMMLRELSKAVAASRPDFVPVTAAFTDFQVRALELEAKYYQLLRRHKKVTDPYVIEMSDAYAKGSNSNEWYEYLGFRYGYDMRDMNRFHKFIEPRISKFTFQDNVDAYEKLMLPLAREILTAGEQALANHRRKPTKDLRELQRVAMRIQAFLPSSARLTRGILANGLRNEELERLISEWQDLTEKLNGVYSDMKKVPEFVPPPVAEKKLLVDSRVVNAFKKEVRTWLEKEAKK